MNYLIGAVLLASYFVVCVNAIATIHQKGAKLFDSTGKQFYIKGIAYQRTPDDPLLDANQCTRDANLMKTLGTNSIRVYHVDPSQKHDDCMSIFGNAGIYVFLDLDTFSTQIDQDNPMWNSTQFSFFAAVMDAFAPYDNLGGFWVGNEVIRTSAGSGAAPFVKAAAADVKAYRDSKNYRTFPIGYSAADIAELRPMLQNYLACGDSANAIQFFGLNSYEWCGTDVDLQTSGYSILQDMAANYSIPIFFSETGCNVGAQRTFADQAAIFGPDMEDTWSGAMIYEWIEEANHYGLVSYDNGVSGNPSPIQPDWNNLQNQWKTLSPSGVKEADYTPSFSPPACPQATAGWLVNGDPPLPTLGVGVVTKITYASTIAAGAVPPMMSTTSSSSSSTSSSSTAPAPAATTSKAAGLTKSQPLKMKDALFWGIGIAAIEWVMI